MKSCIKCKHADWKRTDSGRLHPSGDGRCKYEWTCKPLPASMCWIGRTTPKPSGGYINRREELKDHCTYYLLVQDGK